MSYSFLGGNRFSFAWIDLAGWHSGGCRSWHNLFSLRSKRTMLDRLLTWWIPILFVVVMLSIVLPTTSSSIIRLATDWLYR